MKARDPFFDVVKAIAIIMVVFCHVMWFAPAGTFPIWINNFRVGMNMPIFFIISGYFAWPTIESHNWKKFASGIRSYFQPALFAGLVLLPIGLIIGVIQPTVAAISIRMLRFVFVDPWFITTLAACYILVFTAMAIGKKASVGFAIIAAVWLTVVCRPVGLPGTDTLASFVSMLPHYCFGAIVLRKFNYHLWENLKIGLACLIVFIMFVLLEGDVRVNGMSFYTADSTVRAFTSWRGGITFLLRPLVGIVGSLGLMWFIRFAISMIPRLQLLAKIGPLTLGIYIFHLWPLQRLHCIAWIGSSWWSVLLTALALLAFFSTITWILKEKTGRFRIWIWGK